VSNYFTQCKTKNDAGPLFSKNDLLDGHELSRIKETAYSGLTENIGSVLYRIVFPVPGVLL
jgi:hypothetical protein